MVVSRRILGLLLTASLSLVGVVAGAPPASASPTCDETPTTWSDLKTAISAYGTRTVCLGFDASGLSAVTEDYLDVNPGSDITFDLNGHSLEIYAPEEGSNPAIRVRYAQLTIEATGGGALTAHGGTYSAGIGGGYYESSGNVTINGGEVTAIGGGSYPYGGAGIGGGFAGNSASVTINGGEVTATGGYGSAGIGGGQSGSSSSIAINGGNVTAVGGPNGPGMGGGWTLEGNPYSVTSGDIFVTGGFLTATAGFNAAALGGGQYADGAATTLSGGYITLHTGGDSEPTIGVVHNATPGTLTLKAESVDYTDPTPNQVGTYAAVSLDTPTSAGIDVHREVETTEGNEYIERIIFRMPVSFSDTHGVVVPTQQVNYGAAPTAPTIPENGYDIEAWHDTSSSGPVVNLATQTITSPRTFYGSWMPKSWSVSYDWGNGTAPEVAGASAYLTGEPWPLPSAPTREGCSFTGWALTGANAATSSIAASDLSTTTDGFGDITLTAQWLNSSNSSQSCDPTATSWDELSSAMNMPGAHTVTLGVDITQESGSLVLSDGADITLDLNSHSLSVTAGFGNAAISTTGASLTILATGGGDLTATGGFWSAGIGGGHVGAAGNLTINSGTVTATGGYQGAGLGGGSDGDGSGTTTINGGIVTATGGLYSAGIGSSYLGSAGNITINDGTITATGGLDAAGIGSGYGASVTDIIVNDATITATGGNFGTGIGAGYTGTAGNITINDGTITATGGLDAAGIGSAYAGTAGNITINDGTITATGYDFGAGIGAGFTGTAGNITINDGTITATGGLHASGIGSSYEASVNDIIINDGTVTATGGQSGSGIGAGYFGTVNDITLSGGTITASGMHYGSGIGTGYHGTVNDINVRGGTITASGGYFGSGIGSGNFGAVRDITLSGGIITATGSTCGAAIGSGYFGAARNIAVSGGAVTATGGDFGSGIGSGYFGTFATLLISGGIVNAQGATDGTAITAGSTANMGMTTLSGGVITLTAGASTIGGSLGSPQGIAYLDAESIEGTALVSSDENSPWAAHVAFVEQENSGVDIHQETLTTEPLVTRYTFRNAVTFVTPLVSISAQSVDWGGYAARPRVTSMAGYAITGWHVGAPDGPLFDFTSTPVTNPISLVPSLAPKTYNITYELALGTGSSDAGDATFATGTTFVLPGSPTRTGYTFTGWSVSGAHAEATALATTATTSTVGGWGDITVTAQWRINKYKVTFKSLGGTKVTSKRTNYNTTIKKPKTPKRAGYTFKSWRVGSARGPAFNFTTPITANTTLYALWKKKK